MKRTSIDVSQFYNLVAGPDGTIGLQFMGRIDHHCAAVLIKNLKSEIKAREPKKVSADLNRITYFDDFGVLVLTELRNYLKSRNIPFSLIQPPPKAGEVLALFNFEDPDSCQLMTPQKKQNLIVRLGDAFIRHLYSIRYLVSFLGSVVMCLFHVVRHPSSLRFNDTMDLMQKTGVDAVPIVGLISFLLGLIMAFVSSMQLEQFGASV